MVTRCQGHKSWITGVAFDPWNCDEQTYRFASVSEDCNLVLWDFSLSALQKPKHVSSFVLEEYFLIYMSSPEVFLLSVHLLLNGQLHLLYLYKHHPIYLHF